MKEHMSQKKHKQKRQEAKTPKKTYQYKKYYISVFVNKGDQNGELLYAEATNDWDEAHMLVEDAQLTVENPEVKTQPGNEALTPVAPSNIITPL